MYITNISFPEDTPGTVKTSAEPPPMVLVDRADSLYPLAVFSPQAKVVENVLEEPLLAQNSSVHGNFGFRFCAGTLLVTPDGFVMGLDDQLPYAYEIAQQILEVTPVEVKTCMYHDLRMQNLLVESHELTDKDHPIEVMIRTCQPIYDMEIGMTPASVAGGSFGLTFPSKSYL